MALLGFSARGLPLLALLGLTQPALAQPASRTVAECQIGVGPSGRPVVCMDAFLEVLWDHGTWVNSDRFGHLFCPDPASFGPDFRPFTDGHWVMTPEGWTFVGRHATSWVTDHYGRWVQTGLVACRWGWVPGDAYSPAWVDFHVGESVIAWRPARFDGVPVQLRVPSGVQLAEVRLGELPQAADPNAGFVAVRDGDLDSEKLGKVMLKGVDLYAALREVAPLRDAQVGLHSRTRGEVVAQIPAVRARREAALAQSGAPPEPARRTPKAASGAAGGQGVAGAVRTSKGGNEGRSATGATQRPGDTPPGTGKVYWGGDQNQGGFTRPGPSGGVKVLEWGGPPPPSKPPAPANLPPPSQRLQEPTPKPAR